MGCFQSKKDSGDIHPNVFRVVNIDEGGADLWSGQLEVTENDLILYREGRDATIWPLRCLRRYGFDGEIFSFESGRRCDTGEGIYAFRCRRAGMLFRTLQQNIQLRNVISDTMPFQLPVNILAGSPPAMPRQTLQASIVHRSSIDNGQPAQNTVTNVNNNVTNNVSTQTRVNNNQRQSPRSPSSVDILEVMPLYPRPQNNAIHASNVYQTRGFKSREHNNNQAEASADPRHLYSNDFNRDLALLRNSLRQEAVLNTIKDIEDETHFLQTRYINKNIPINNQNIPLSPTPSNMSEPYAQLSMEQQESARMYMNVATDPSGSGYRSDASPTTPITPKPAEYSNINLNGKPEMNSYANLALGDATDAKQAFTFPSTEHRHKYSESDTYTSMSPVEELEVNYAILDIEGNKEPIRPRDITSPETQSYASSKNESMASHCSSQARGRLISQGSTEKVTSAPAGIGYTTIDFDKTVALTSVATNAEMVADGSRKTRHNSLACNSSNSTEKSRGN